MTQSTGPRDDGIRLPPEELRYVPPQHILSVPDLRRAIALAISDLAARYGIHLRKPPAEDPPATEELADRQISLFEVFSPLPPAA